MNYVFSSCGCLDFVEFRPLPKIDERDFAPRKYVGERDDFLMVKILDDLVLRCTRLYGQYDYMLER